MKRKIQELMDYLPQLKIGDVVKMKFLYCGGQYGPMLDIPYFFCSNKIDSIEKDEYTELETAGKLKKYAFLYSYDIIKYSKYDDYTEDIIKITDIKLKELKDIDQRIISYYSKFKYDFEKQVKDIKIVKRRLKEIARKFGMDELRKRIEKAETGYEISDIIGYIYSDFQEMQKEIDLTEGTLDSIKETLSN